MSGEIADAAASGDVVRIGFLVCAVVIILLGSGLWFMIRERMQLNKERLKAGVERMNGLEEKDDQQDQALQAICTNYVHKDNCNDVREARDRSREKLEKSLDRIAEHQGCIDTKLGKLDTKVDTKLETITGMLSKIMNVGHREEA